MREQTLLEELYSIYFFLDFEAPFWCGIDLFIVW